MSLVNGIASCTIDDISVGIVNGNLFAFRLLIGQGSYLSDAHLVDVVVLVNLQEFLYLCLDLVGIEQLVNQFHADILVRIGKRDEAVGIGVQLVNGEVAAGTDLLGDILPDTIDIGLRLFAVLITHLVASEHLSSTLIRPHLGNLNLHAELAEQVFHEDGLCGNTVPVDHTLRVQIDLVGNR